MKKLLYGIFGLAVSAQAALLALWLLPAKANVPCSVPFNLTNGTLADASQVMANYNALIACLTNAAAQGANSDITQLLGLTTPLAPSFGGTNVFNGGTATGTNAITTTSMPNSFSLTAGYKIVFVAGGSNTAATTLNVAATGVKNLFRETPGGPVAMVGGEIITGQTVEAVYDGTQFQMTSKPALDMPPGMVFDYAGAAGCPVGSLLANGGTTALATLTAILGTTWGVSGTLPDLRGRTTFSADSGGSGRITVAGGNFDGTVVGGTGGQQSQTLTIAQLPVVTPAGSVTLNNLAIGTTTPATQIGAGAAVAARTDSSTPSATFSGTPFGSGNSHPVLSNAAIVLKCVKA